MSKNAARDQARREYWADLDKQTYQCPDCGRSSNELRTGFEVHHKDGNPENNDPENLIGLCRPCHNIREGKKPSLNEIELMRDQLAGSGNVGQNWAYITSGDEVDPHFKLCDSQCIPTMQVNSLNRQKYAGVQIDFISTEGWKRFVREPDGDVVETDASPDFPADIIEPAAQLTEDATKAVNSIMRKYKSEKFAASYMTAPRTSYGAGFIAYPPLLPDVAKNLAGELEPIVMNEDNWEPSNMKDNFITYTEYVAEYGGS